MKQFKLTHTNRKIIWNKIYAVFVYILLYGLIGVTLMFIVFGIIILLLGTGFKEVISDLIVLYKIIPFLIGLGLLSTIKDILDLIINRKHIITSDNYEVFSKQKKNGNVIFYIKFNDIKDLEFPLFDDARNGINLDLPITFDYSKFGKILLGYNQGINIWVNNHKIFNRKKKKLNTT